MGMAPAVIGDRLVLVGIGKTLYALNLKKYLGKDGTAYIQPFTKEFSTMSIFIRSASLGFLLLMTALAFGQNQPLSLIHI